MRARPLDLAGVLLPLLFVAALGLAGAGCTRISVAHLEAKPWRAGLAETVITKYWRFAYTAYLSGEAYGLRGMATPVPAVLPSWADRLEELTITVFLRDASGNVVAQADKTYRGMPLRPDAAMPFSFELHPDPVAAAGDLSVSFGYKALYGSSKARAALPAAGQPPAGTVFFASEGAITRR
ncbi:MAG: hypothetical protein AB7U59_06970 [Desulfovibrionaceae bacterium]|jgi:hypothetical protein